MPDGKFIQYLDNPSKVELTLSNCDPALFTLIKDVAFAEPRCVADIQRSGILPSDTLYYPSYPDPSRQEYPDYLTFDGIPQNQRPDARREWAQRGRDALADAELVLIDPDNGLEVPSTLPHHAKGPKYAYYDELHPYWKCGQSLIIYQHAIRMLEGKGISVDELARKRCKELRSKLPGATLHALRFHRRSTRLFLVAAQPKHAVILDARVRSFLNSCWGKGRNPHFTKAPAKPR